MEDTIIIAGLKWVGGGVVAAMAWFGKGMLADIKTLKDDSNECALRLETFKTHVSEHYAKEVSMQASLARVHDRLESGFKEIREDIRSIRK